MSESRGPETVVCLGCGGLVLPDAQHTTAAGPVCRCAASSSEAKAVVCSVCGGPLRVGARSCPHCGSTLATCRCRACFAWNLAVAEHCQACGGALEGEHRPASLPGNLGCPRCSSALAARDYAELAVEECDRCGGIFLAPEMLERVVEARDRSTGLRLALPRRQSTPETRVRYLQCPACGKTMNRQAFGRISGVVVDVCREHGVWFDPGELTLVLDFVAKGGLERAQERAAEARAEELRSMRSTQAYVAAQPSSCSEGVDYGELLTELVSTLADLWRR